MRFRDLEGWESTVNAVLYVWRWTTPELWEIVGDSEAPFYVHHLAGTGEVMMQAWRLGLVKERRN